MANETMSGDPADPEAQGAAAGGAPAADDQWQGPPDDGVWLFGGGPSNPRLLDEALDRLAAAGSYAGASGLVFDYSQALGVIDANVLQQAFEAWADPARDRWYADVNDYWTPLNQAAVDAAAGKR